MEGPKRGGSGTVPLELDMTLPDATMRSAGAPRASGKPPAALPEVPDLVLDVPPRPSGIAARVSQAPSPRISHAPAPDLGGPELSAPPPPRASGPAPVGGSRTSLDDDEDALGAGAGISLDLDLGGALPHHSHPPAPAGSLPPAAASGRSLPPAAGSGRSLPPGRTSAASLPPVSVPPVDAAAVSALAAFGDPPKAAPWMAPLYAYRVWTRRTELEREVVRRRDQARLARSQAEDELLGFAVRVRARAEASASSSASLAAALEALHQAETSLRAHDPTAAAALDEHAAQVASSVARAAALEAERDGALAADREVEVHSVGFREARAHAEERQQRIENDIRGAMARLQAEDDPHLRAQLEAQIARAAAERDRLALELRSPALVEYERRAAASRAAVASAQGALDALAREAQAQGERMLRQLGLRGGPMDDARKAVREALVALGTAVIGAADVIGAEAIGRDPAAKTLSHVRKLEEAVSLHERAREAYDRPMVTLGLGIAGGIAAFLLLLLMFPFIYRVFAG